MNLIEGEKVIAEHESLVLTNLRIFKDEDDFLSRIYREIPLNQISSVKYASRINKRLGSCFGKCLSVLKLKQSNGFNFFKV